MQWLIEIIQDWVIAQVYATEAWVLAKLYLQKAEYPGYGMPVHVTGVLVPDATCTYFRCGDYNGKPCYSQEDGSYFIWWGVANWNIGTAIGGGPAERLWRRNDPVVFGDYAATVGSSGIATVTSGYKYLLTSFVNRGDPAAFDFTLNDFTRDGAWHDLDLSSIVPAGAKAVSLYSRVKDMAILRYIFFRTKGNANEANISANYAQVANIWIGNDFVVPLDADRVIQYKSNIQIFMTCDLTVKGWWL